MLNDFATRLRFSIVKARIFPDAAVLDGEGPVERPADHYERITGAADREKLARTIRNMGYAAAHLTYDERLVAKNTFVSAQTADAECEGMLQAAVALISGTLEPLGVNYEGLGGDLSSATLERLGQHLPQMDAETLRHLRNTLVTREFADAAVRGRQIATVEFMDGYRDARRAVMHAEEQQALLYKSLPRSIAEALVQGPKTANDLGSFLGVGLKEVEKTLRAMHKLGIIHARSTNQLQYDLTPIGKDLIG